MGFWIKNTKRNFQNTNQVCRSLLVYLYRDETSNVFTSLFIAPWYYFIRQPSKISHQCVVHLPLSLPIYLPSNLSVCIPIDLSIYLSTYSATYSFFYIREAKPRQALKRGHHVCMCARGGCETAGASVHLQKISNSRITMLVGHFYKNVCPNSGNFLVLLHRLCGNVFYFFLFGGVGLNPLRSLCRSPRFV
jgi:hypothetical protein